MEHVPAPPEIPESNRKYIPLLVRHIFHSLCLPTSWHFLALRLPTIEDTRFNRYKKIRLSYILS